MHARISVLLTWLILASHAALAQEAARIDLEGPAQVAVKQSCQIWVQGMTPQQLGLSSVECDPAEGVTLIPATSWGGKAFLFFQASKEGSYTVKVSLNAWRDAIDESLVAAQASPLDEDLLSQYKAVVSAIQNAYPSAIGEHTIQVGDEDDEVDPPLPGKYHLLIIEESGQRKPPWGDLFIEIRTDQEMRAAWQVYIVDQDGEDSQGKPIQNVSKYIKAVDGPLPYMFVIKEGAPNQGTVVWRGTMPTTLQELKQQIKPYAN